MHTAPREGEEREEGADESVHGSEVHAVLADIGIQESRHLIPATQGPCRVQYAQRTLRVPLCTLADEAHIAALHRHTGWRKWEKGWRDRVPEIDVDRRVEVGAALPLVLGRRQPFEERLHVRRYGEPHRS